MLIISPPSFRVTDISLSYAQVDTTGKFHSLGVARDKCQLILSQAAGLTSANSSNSKRQDALLASALSQV